jgi:hypothetical protein
MISDEEEINVSEMRKEDRKGRDVIVLYVKKRNGKGILKGKVVVERIKEKMMKD